jgi:NAD(P)-dependent dehydrogenase (short-subunit alcohol dehydrogenase family)
LILVRVGATASMRGRANFAAFASAKFGLRALSQSMARELGPHGIHVVHVVIDGAIDTPWVHATFPDQALARKATDGMSRKDHHDKKNEDKDQDEDATCIDDDFP